MKGVWVSKEDCVLKDFAIPEPGPDEVLIKNVCVASNPKDWKIPFYMAPYASIEGNDVAGYVESVGNGVTEYKKGDKVAAFTKMRTDVKYGAYAEYSVALVSCTFPLGPKTSFEDASTLPLAYGTAAIGLFKRLGLSTDSAANTSSGALLVYGASSTVGVFAVQLAKLAGLKVVGVAGSSAQRAKSYGADEMIDYRGKSEDELAEAIAKAADGKIRYCFDCVSEKSSMEVVAKGLEEHGGKYTYVLGSSKESLPKNLETILTLVATAYGDDEEFMREWYRKAGKMLEDETFRGQKVTILGGLDAVKQGLKRLQEGKVSGEKFVYRVSETPGATA